MHIYTEPTVTAYDNIISKMKESNVSINRKSFINFLIDENLPDDIKDELLLLYTHESNNRIRISIITFIVIIMIITGAVIVGLYGRSQTA